MKLTVPYFANFINKYFIDISLYHNENQIQFYDKITD